MQRCVIIDYGSGNLRSAAKAFERAATEAELDVEILVSSDVAVVRQADRLVLPGVGAFADCRHGLDTVPGLVEALEQRARRDAVPFLGICVGMQLLAERGLEFVTSTGLGWIEGDVVAIDPVQAGDEPLKVPHMGWNDLVIDPEQPGHPVLAGIETGMHAYFVHSYHVAVTRVTDRLAFVEYGSPIAAVIGRDNVIGTQFHPEKSQATGLRLIGNFLRWVP
ncbi:MAG TPA: imidazole glycerol phosphate synthase subunit HisH [Stellaceae bacterium]|nr:imidazole glycerol phosphate synthase subunit HisH [Stellaceae bacterium]